MSTRQDIHRPGAIIPAEYKWVSHYSLSHTDGGWPVPSFGINCELDRASRDRNGAIIEMGKHNADGMCCVVGMRHHQTAHKFALDGSPGKCDVCGTPHIHGEVWMHTPTGDLIVIGHICADKYGLLADRSAFELALGRRNAAIARQLQVEVNREKRAAFLADPDNAGLEAAFELAEKHHILGDLARKFQLYCNLSPKQVALALKIAKELTEKAERPVEVHVEAPIGRVTFEGEVVSLKYYEGYMGHGEVCKMIVKVTTDAGIWLCFVTRPDAMASPVNGLRGCRVRLKATLKHGNDKHFALGSRPTNCEITFDPNAKVTSEAAQ